MKDNTKVIPKIGHYVIITVDRRWGMQTQYVGKDRRCSCGGNARRPCRHIRAVADYLRHGGKRALEASEERAMLHLREKHDDDPLSGTPTTCPICGEEIEHLGQYFNQFNKCYMSNWKCKANSSHYWVWRSRQTLSAPRDGTSWTKMAFGMTAAEYKKYLDELAERRWPWPDSYSPYP